MIMCVTSENPIRRNINLDFKVMIILLSIGYEKNKRSAETITQFSKFYH